MTHLEYLTKLKEKLDSINGAGADTNSDQAPSFDAAVEAAMRRLIGKRDN